MESPGCFRLTKMCLGTRRLQPLRFGALWFWVIAKQNYLLTSENCWRTCHKSGIILLCCLQDVHGKSMSAGMDFLLLLTKSDLSFDWQFLFAISGDAKAFQSIAQLCKPLHDWFLRIPMFTQNHCMSAVFFNVPGKLITFSLYGNGDKKICFCSIFIWTYVQYACYFPYHWK